MPQNVGQTPVQPQMPVGVPVQQKAPMDANAIKRYVGMGSGALLLIASFLPLISAFGMSVNFWDAKPGTLYSIVFVVLCLVPCLVYFLQKCKQLSYLTVGFMLSYVVNLISAGTSGASIGYWLFILATIALAVVTIMEDLPNIKAMIPTKTVTVAPVAPVAGQPVPPVTPTVQNVQVCKHCGQPRKNPADQFCQGCGQRYE